LYRRMTTLQTSNQNRNKPMFHATFLDGVRGVAALSVVWAHSQNVYIQRLDFNTFDLMGTYGYHEKREEEKNTDSAVNKIDHLESCVDLETNISNVPLLSSTNSDNF
ncbi:10125_t:CDS:2, partial [Racocetra persica]